MTKFNRKDYIYTPLFCEENIWKLVESLYMSQLAKPIDVLFIINKAHTVAILNQNQSINTNPVIWDYHVILLAHTNNELVIFDFDSRCEFPTPVEIYFKLSFPSIININDKLLPYIKKIKAQYYFEHFYSDRAHMNGIISKKEFPAYEIIQPEKSIEKLPLTQCRDILLTGDYSEIKSPDDYLESILLN